LPKIPIGIPVNMIYGDSPVKWNEREPDAKDPLGLNDYTYKPDIYAIMQSGNLYVYCGDNPILWGDSSGEFWHIIIGAVIGATFSTAISVATQLATADQVKLSTTLIAAGAGAVSGGLAASGVGIVGQIFLNGTIGAATNVTQQLFNNGGSFDNLSGWSIAASVGVGMLAGALGGKGADYNNHLSSLSNQLTNRIGNAFAYKTGDALTKELTNAFSYFMKNAGTTLVKNWQSIIRANIPAATLGGVAALNKLIAAIEAAIKQ